jgi:hypothetical protein
LEEFVKKIIWLVGAAALLSTVSAAVIADSILVTGFEKPDFQGNTLLDGQDAWASVTAPNAIRVSTVEPQSGKQCILMSGTDAERRTGRIYRAVCGRFLAYDPVANGNSIMRFHVGARLNGPDTGDGLKDDVVEATFYVSPGPNQTFGKFYVSGNGTIYCKPGGTDAYAFSTPYELGSYVNLDLVLDFNAGTTTFLVNGQAIGTSPMSTEPLVPTEISVAPLELLIDRRVDHTLYSAQFDNYAVTAGN